MKNSGLIILLSLALISPALAVKVPDNYRMKRYRAPTPQTVAGAVTVNTAEVRQLIKVEKPILIDVSAVPYRPEMLDFGGEWLVSTPRYNLPNSVWLPNVGYGEISAQIKTYFTENLRRLTKDNKNYPIVFYCIADCWMSWNACKRAARLGYTRIYWYREGTDGWTDEDYKTVLSTPIPLTIDTTAE